MFTGIISATGLIESAQRKGDLRLAIACPYDTASVHIGDSIACNGACLTVVAIAPLPSGCRFTVELSAETLARTAAHWDIGQRLNLERALRLGDTLDGHMVTGHIDGLATVCGITPSGGSYIFEFSAPPKLARFIAEKGSVALDGISLTVNKVEGSRFWVNIIPHTWSITTLGERQPGDTLNLEIDLIARYINRIINNQ